MARDSSRSPVVSICVPLYNGERHLAHCLASVAAQSFTDFEVILLDDCSRDATYELARCHTARDPRARVLRNDRNLGLVGNWNRCLELARGRWIKFLFQDDTMHPGCVESLLRAVEPGTALVACRSALLFEEGTAEAVRKLYVDHRTLVAEFFGDGGTLSPHQVQSFALERFGTNPFGEPTSVMFRRRMVRDFGFFNSAFVSSCDFEYWLRLAVHHGATVVPRELTTFRVHRGAVSADNFGRRHYHTMVLDNLILLHEFAFAPVYEPVRRLAEQKGMNLRQMLHERKNEARAIAAWASQRPSSDSSLLTDFNTIAQRYPRVAPGLLSHLLWRVRRRVGAWLGRTRAATVAPGR